MKTIITSRGNKLNSGFELRFGRAAWFCLLDEETGETTFYKNQVTDTMYGACPKAADKVVELGATRVISGDFSPKAKKLLEKFNIQMVQLSEVSKSIKDIVNTIKLTS